VCQYATSNGKNCQYASRNKARRLQAVRELASVYRLFAASRVVSSTLANRNSVTKLLRAGLRLSRRLETAASVSKLLVQGMAVFHMQEPVSILSYSQEMVFRL